MVMKKQKPVISNSPAMEAPTSTSSKTNPISKTISIVKNPKPISKTNPKIRIIHIFAPEIIKTDATNFRELVQRLTGKPHSPATKNKPKIARQEEPTREFAGGVMTSPPAATKNKPKITIPEEPTRELAGGVMTSPKIAIQEEPTRELAGCVMTSAPAVKEECWDNAGGVMTSAPAVKEECWDNAGGGFLGGFQDLDGYFSVNEFCELPFYPFDQSLLHTMHVVDYEPQLIA